MRDIWINTLFDWTLGKVFAAVATRGKFPIQETWKRTHRWDAAHGNGAQVIANDVNRELLDKAIELASEGAQEMFPVWKELAESGSVYSMNNLAWCYLTGSGVLLDTGEAERWYAAASKGGSQWASLRLASILADKGEYRLASEVLEPLASNNWAPAKFWLAWHRLQQSMCSTALQSSLPLLEEALEAGHPGAKWYLGRLMAQGKYGGENRSRGRALLLELSSDLVEHINASGRAEVDPRKNT